MICFRSFEKRASSGCPFRGFFSSLDMIFQTWSSILRSSFFSDHFGPRLDSRSERRNLIESSASFPSRYSSTGSEPRIRAESKKLLTRIFENRQADFRRAGIPVVDSSRSANPLAETISTNHSATLDQSCVLLSGTAIRNYLHKPRGAEQGSSLQE